MSEAEGEWDEEGGWEEGQGDWDLKWQMLVADTWDDEGLKQRLLDDTATVLKERGIDSPEGVTIKVVADSDDTVNLVLPAAPSEDMLSEEELESVAGGFGCGGGCGGCGRCGRCSRCRFGRCRCGRCRCGFGGRCSRCRCGPRCRCRCGP